MSKTTVTISQDVKDVSSDLHYVPCHLLEDADAPVSTYFLPSIKKHPELENVKTASYRGRPLIGTKLELPNGYRGALIENKETNDETKTYVVSKTFHNLQYWNWDQIPTKDDKILRAMDWVAVSGAIHGSVETSSVNNAIKGKNVSPKKGKKK